MPIKFCKFCNDSYPKTKAHWYFQKAPDCLDGVVYRCKRKVAEQGRSPKSKATRTKYRKTAAYKEAYTRYNRSDKARAARQRYKNSEKYLSSIHPILAKIRTRLLRAVESNAKAGSAVSDLGCSIDYFKYHIESQFLDGMTWENHGEWHFDHIVPLSTFDLTNREEFLKAVNFNNIQPLWATDNIRKGAN